MERLRSRQFNPHIPFSAMSGMKLQRPTLNGAVMYQQNDAELKLQIERDERIHRESSRSRVTGCQMGITVNILSVQIVKHSKANNRSFDHQELKLSKK
jgi:hypothetical protein